MSHPNFTPKEGNERYLIQLLGMLFTAIRTNNERVVIALQSLIDRVARRGLGVN